MCQKGQRTVWVIRLEKWVECVVYNLDYHPKQFGFVPKVLETLTLR